MDTKPTVTKDQIAALLAASEIEVSTIFDKVTLVAVKLPCGFVLTESAGAVSKENYSQDIGKDVCLRKIESKLWQLEGYALSKRVAEQGERSITFSELADYFRKTEEAIREFPGDDEIRRDLSFGRPELTPEEVGRLCARDLFEGVPAFWPISPEAYATIQQLRALFPDHETAERFLVDAVKRIEELEHRTRTCATMDEAEKFALVRALQSIARAVGLNDENSPAEIVARVEHLAS